MMQERYERRQGLRFHRRLLCRRRSTDIGRHDWILRHIPVPLIEYPAELLIAAWGLISGPAVLGGVSSPSSLDQTLPRPGAQMWGLFLVCGGLFIAAGLWRRSYGGLVSIGLRLLGSASLVYGVTILLVTGFIGGVPAGPLLLVIAILCYFRAWWLQERRRTLRRVYREKVLHEPRHGGS